MEKEKAAYIAGFLDGDGCIMLQLIYRKDYLLGYQIRASIVFYQKQQNRYYLEWLKQKLGDGYIRNRGDGMSEYTIVGIQSVRRILEMLKPYLVLKRKHVKVALYVLEKMPGTGRKMRPEVLLKLAKYVDKFATLNYSKKRTNTSKEVTRFLLSHKLLRSRRD